MAKAPGHPFYEKLNGVLEEARFDEQLEELAGPYYAEKMGRPPLSPGIYVRMLLVGRFEGIDSERGIACRCADSWASLLAGGGRGAGRPPAEEGPDTADSAKGGTRPDCRGGPARAGASDFEENWTVCGVV